MSAPLVISKIDFVNNPAEWKDSYKVQITFEAHEELKKDAEWHLIYVGSASDEEHDQMLESVVVGPIAKGRHKFEFEAAAPDPSKIPPENIQDITILLLKCFYDGKMFSKIGWFVTNEYEEEELQLNKPAQPILEKLKRQIKIDDVRVTNYTCCWREEEPPAIDEAEAEKGEIAFTVGQKDANEEEIEVSDDDDDEEDAERDITAEISANVSMINVNDENDDKKDEDVAMVDEATVNVGDGGKGDAATAGAEVFAEKTNV
jgi:histone chaperone ASF1